MASDNNYLRRYTNLPALIYLLREQKLTLLDPRSWDDSNDSHYLALYREKKRLKSVLVACFTQADETYHHWRVFAAGSGGVCIRFNRSSLLRAVKKLPDVRSRKVTYLRLTEIRNRTPKIEELPFLKRYAFEHENELRIVYESKKKRLDKLDISIPLECIERVTLSPWLDVDLSNNVRELIQTLSNGASFEVVRSTLISNQEWKALGEQAQ